MAIGWVFKLGGDAYLLVGVPLVVVFQLGVRRQPLSSLWLRESTGFHPGWLGLLVGVVWAALPCAKLMAQARSAAWPVILWYVACAVGAVGAGFALCHFNRASVRSLCCCLMTAGFVGCVTVLTAAFMLHGSLAVPWRRVASGAVDFALYVPVCFVLEEVVFRGALDSHVYHAGESRPLSSAIYVSALWGLWHLPLLGLTGVGQFIVLLLRVVAGHVVVGVFLAEGWRRSGNLGVPAIVHAFIDAVRNIFLAG